MATVTMHDLIGPERRLLPDPDGLYEIIDGERREVAPMGVLAGFLAFRLGGLLDRYGSEHNLGMAVVECLFKLTPEGKRKRRPDVAYFSFAKLNSQSRLGEDPEFWDFAPDLAIEVNSLSNTGQEILEKIDEYFQAGVQLVWVVYPRQRRFYIYSSPTQVRVLTEADELDGGQVISGFRLPIASLFASLAPHS